VTVVLFDFFGTLVRYSPSRSSQGYPRTDALLRGLGMTVPYEEWLRVWGEVSTEFDRGSEATLVEYSMRQVADAFLPRVGIAPDEDHANAVIAAFLEEWNTGVTDIDGVPEMLRDLAAEHRLAVVSNTHDPDLVPDHLERLGIASYVDVVVLSVEVGVKKPHPDIYQTALALLGARPEDAVFVGDTVDADHTGPVRAGMRALLIGDDVSVPANDQIASVIEVPSALSSARDRRDVEVAGRSPVAPASPGRSEGGSAGCRR
jgi:putative hydrolase of the HAD superfamily